LNIKRHYHGTLRETAHSFTVCEIAHSSTVCEIAHSFTVCGIAHSFYAQAESKEIFIIQLCEEVSALCDVQRCVAIVRIVYHDLIDIFVTIQLISL
jgi:hypothetical protein